jgi:hypothetical protein
MSAFDDGQAVEETLDSRLRGSDDESFRVGGTSEPRP